MKKVMLVLGTRPDAVKMCPLIKELKRRENITVITCATGQHNEMLEQVLFDFGVKADYDLGVMLEYQTLFDITTKVMTGINTILEADRPDIVLVHGDTTTAFASALACYYLNIPVGHIEAGLRTYNIFSPYPEEFNRQAVGIISGYHFAPTQNCKDNLIREGKDPARIYVTGNTVIDALKTTVSAEYTHPLLDWASGSRLVILTAHRRENLGKPLHRMLKSILRVIDEFPDVKLIYPVHMNPTVKSAAESILGNHERIRLINPLGVRDFHNFMARAYLILTDSGGIQEEAPFLGKPVLVMRDTTERPEGVEAGTLKLTGTGENDIYSEFRRLLADQAEYKRMSATQNPYGDGNASKRIADILQNL